MFWSKFGREGRRGMGGGWKGLPSAPDLLTRSETLRNHRLFLNSLRSPRSESMSSHHDLPQGSVALAGSG